MKILFDILLFASCIGIFIQDMRQRMVSVVLFVILFAVLLTNFIFFSSDENNTLLLLANVLFISAQIGILWLYFKYIKKSKLRFFDAVFGLGDVIMMFTMAMVFPLGELLVFLLFCYLVTLILGILLQQKTFPLAGIMALCFLLVQTVNYFLNNPLLLTFTT